MITNGEIIRLGKLGSLSLRMSSEKCKIGITSVARCGISCVAFCGWEDVEGSREAYPEEALSNQYITLFLLQKMQHYENYRLCF